MPDTTQERVSLAMLARELGNQMRLNKDFIFAPVIANENQVSHYYQAYKDYLKKALTFPELPHRDLLEPRLSLQTPVHRDNLGSLAGRIGELAGALEASFVDIVRDLANSRAEATQLASELQRVKDENAELKARLGKPRVLGEG